MMLPKSYKRMPLELEQILRANVKPLTVRKHNIIQPTATITDHLYFVEKGLFHLFLDRESIIQFQPLHTSSGTSAPGKPSKPLRPNA